MTRDERQEIARVKWIKNKCVGTLEMPTGTGKTRTALKCLNSVINKYPTLRVLVVVPTTNLVEQWKPQLDNWGLGFNTDVQVINSVIRKNWECDILVLDECHVSPANTFQQVFTKVKYKYILGLTATFERLDGKHEILNKYCPVIDKITTVEALANGWISEFKEYEVMISVDNIEEYEQFNLDFIKHFEFFGFSWDLAMSCIGKDGFINRAKLRDQMCPKGTESERKAMFTQITYHATGFIRAVQARKAFVNNHPKKAEIARRIIEARPTSKILTFSNNIKMAESIGLGPVYSGKDTKKKGRITLEEFSSQAFGVLHSSKKLIAGADIPGLSIAIILGHDSSETRAVQSRGRAIRKEGDKQAEIFNIIIEDSIEAKWFENSHKSTPYIVIGEDGLQDVLDGKEPRPYNKQSRKYTFRY